MYKSLHISYIRIRRATDKKCALTCSDIQLRASEASKAVTAFRSILSPSNFHKGVGVMLVATLDCTLLAGAATALEGWKVGNHGEG